MTVRKIALRLLLLIASAACTCAGAYAEEPWLLTGDANRDCIVDLVDLVFVRNRLGADTFDGINHQADINEDGTIDFADLIEVRNRLGDECTELIEYDSITLSNHETVGISGFCDYWEYSYPGSRTVDAVHRSVLLRFPGSARDIAQRLEQGGVISRAEIVFEYDGYELNPSSAGYTVRVYSIWETNPPQWHLVGWALRQPWTNSVSSLRPSFNAYLRNAGYWTKYGARDESTDRYPAMLGPAEISIANPQGSMDITPVLLDEGFGETLGERLRFFEEQGLILRKWETYDHRYQQWDSYEWQVPTGGHGLTFRNPRLVVHIAYGRTRNLELPPARNLLTLAAQLAASGEGGEPTAVMPSSTQVQQLAQQAELQQPDWMPDWQWQRVQELKQLGGGTLSSNAELLQSGEFYDYGNLVSKILAITPRYWQGWGIQDDLILYLMYKDQLPAYVEDHTERYWDAWLYPDRPNNELLSPQGQEKLDWWDQHRDWRGIASFFRSRFTQGVSTMNFNHTANMGALLGGNIIGAEIPMADGRSGLENLLLRFWSYLDGTSQEMLDHYYFSITLSGQKMFADYGPTHCDRVMGNMILDRAMELLTSSYHPHLRRVVGASGRVRMSNVLGFEQEGIYSALHTLSPNGVLFNIAAGYDGKQRGMYLFGYDFPPGRAAYQSVRQPWAPEWASHVLDDKPIPYEVTATETTRNNFTNPPLWRRAYLGHHYGLASQDIKGGTVDVMAQWHPEDTPATDAEQLGTLTLRYSINQPRLSETGGGVMPCSGGVVTFQHKNRAIVATKPRTEKDRTISIAGEQGVLSLSSTIALWNWRDTSTWQLYVDGQQVTSYPRHVTAGQVITIRDGSAYIGIIPLPATDLGRTDEIVIEPGFDAPLGDRHSGVSIAPALMINSYNMQRTTPLPEDDPIWEQLCRESYGGFVIEMGDVEEYGSFQAFQTHMQAAVLTTQWEAAARTLHIDYQSGTDLMEMGFCTDYRQADVHYGVIPGDHRIALPYRRINGNDPYLPSKIERDTTLSQQGTIGLLEKNGAALTTEYGRKAYLQTEPVSGTYTGYNPVPDLTAWSLTTPGGIEVKADGRIGLLRVSVRPAESKLWVMSAEMPRHAGEPNLARSLLVFGFAAQPQVEVNGTLLTEPLEQVEIGGRQAYRVPLTEPE